MRALVSARGVGSTSWTGERERRGGGAGGGRAAARRTGRAEARDGANARRRVRVRDAPSDFTNDGGAYERYSSSGESVSSSGDAEGAKDAARDATSAARDAFDTRSSATSATSAADRVTSYDNEFATFIRARKQASEAETRKRWNEGAATPRVAFDLGADYIRRVAVSFPYAVVGSARGTIAVCDVVSATAIAVAPMAHGKDWADAGERPLGERVLLGAHDGGAVTAVAITTSMSKSERTDFGLVASGGRDGTVRLHSVNKNSAALYEIGLARHDGVVTGVTFARDSLWSVALDGRLCRWGLTPSAAALAESDALKRARDSLAAVTREYVRDPPPTLSKQGEWRSGQPTLCVSSCERGGVISIGNADGSAAILSASASAFGGESSVVHAWIAHEDSTVRSISHCPGNGIITGGGDGVIRVWRLMLDEDAGFDSLGSRSIPRGGTSRCVPRLVAELRGHTAPVVSLSAGCPGRLVSGAQDGTIRVWDLDLTDSKPGQRIKTVRRDARYAVLGHTMWLGSTYADAERIICDGANNVLLEYDFSSPADDA